MLVNGDEIKVYDLDTSQTIINKIAAILNTLPIYLSFTPPLSYSENNIVVSFTTICSTPPFISKFSEFIEVHKLALDNLYNKNAENSRKKIFDIWLAYNKTLLSKFRNSSVLEVFIEEMTAEKMFKDITDGEKFIKNIEGFKQSLNKEIEKNKDKVDKQDRDSEEFQGEKEMSRYVFDSLTSALEIEDEKEKDQKLIELEEQDKILIEEGSTFIEQKRQILYKWRLNIFLSYLEIFNAIILNKNVPFAQLGKFYKIFKTYNINEGDVNFQYDSSNETILCIKIKNKEGVYDNIFLEIEMNGNTFPSISTTINIKEYINALDDIVSIFKNINLTLEEQNEMNVSGFFFLPYEYFNSYVMNDMIMNDPLFSLMYCDEKIQTVKRQTHEEDQYLFIYFYHPSTSEISFSMIQKFIVKSDIEIRGLFLQKYPSYTPYIRLNVKGKTVADINRFRIIFGKYMSIYKQRASAVIKIYRQYIKDFGIHVLPKSLEVEKTNDIKYQGILKPINPRGCLHKPKILTIDEGQNREEVLQSLGITERNVLKFPRDAIEGENVKKYLTDGMSQKEFYCPPHNGKEMYVGLQENKDESAKDQPYYICCYEKPQHTTVEYKKYYQLEDIKTEQKTYNTEIKTNKLLQYKQIGVLPPELTAILNIITEGASYKRMGVDRSYSSLLSCVLLATKHSDYINLQSKEERIAFVNEYRKTLADSVILSSQSTFFQLNPVEDLVNPEVYMEPKYYMQMLATMFMSNIYVFNYDDILTNPSSSLKLPNFSQSWLKFDTSSQKTIVIYEHRGGQTDSAKYPQCELIIFGDTKKTLRYSSTDIISKSLYKVFSKLTESYILDVPQKDIVFVQPSDSVKFLSQEIDSYGKCRKLNLSITFEEKTSESEKQDIIFSLFTTPIPPLFFIDDGYIYPVLIGKKMRSINNIETAIRIAEFLGNITHISVVNEICTGIKLIIGNVESEIYLDREDVKMLSVESVPEKYKLYISENVNGLSTKSQKNSNYSLETFNKNKKMARYLTEYVYWRYIEFIKNKYSKLLIYNGDVPVGIKEDSSAAIMTEFVNDNIIIDKKFEYKTTPVKFFSLDSPFMQNNKLVVQSDEILKRLIYSLRLEILYNPKQLVSYLINPSIIGYYKDISDFDKNDKQYLFYDKNKVLTWITNRNIKYDARREVMVNIYKSYFFQNDLIDDTVYLAYNVLALPKAIEYAYRWIENNNIIEKSSFEKNESSYKSVSYILYRYVNADDIQKYYMKGDVSVLEKDWEGSDIETSPSPKLLGFKIDSISYFTILMSLSASIKK